jgi:hypothetical protein
MQIQKTQINKSECPLFEFLSVVLTAVLFLIDNTSAQVGIQC